MSTKRKQWSTRTLPTMKHHRHGSEAATYRYIQSQASEWERGVLRSPIITVYVDERDGRGWRTHERIDLRDIVALWQHDDPTDSASIATRLRSEAAALYRRSDNVPLAVGDGSIDRVAMLREEADELMRQANELDPEVK